MLRVEGARIEEPSKTDPGIMRDLVELLAGAVGELLTGLGLRRDHREILLRFILADAGRMVIQGGAEGAEAFIFEGEDAVASVLIEVDALEREVNAEGALVEAERGLNGLLIEPALDAIERGLEPFLRAFALAELP